MRRILLSCLALLTAGLGLSATATAGKVNPAGYPLRVHIFQFNGYSHYHNNGSGISNSLDSVDGEGRANLYANGQPHSVDFSYSCSRRLMVSPGYETFIARWKKPDRMLEILLPQMGGDPGKMDSCELKVTVKPDSAYVRHNGLLGEEPAAQFKDWMDKHQYDPEHGKNEPLRLPGDPSPQSSQELPNPRLNGNSANSQP